MCVLVEENKKKTERELDRMRIRIYYEMRRRGNAFVVVSYLFPVISVNLCQLFLQISFRYPYISMYVMMMRM